MIREAATQDSGPTCLHQPVLDVGVVFLFKKKLILVRTGFMTNARH